MQPKAPACYRQVLFLYLLLRKGCDPIDTTYTIPLTETQYTSLLERAAELDIPLEDLLLRAMENFLREDESHA